MKRLNALTLLGVGIFAGGTGSYWLAQRGELAEEGRGCVEQAPAGL